MWERNVHIHVTYHNRHHLYKCREEFGLFLPPTVNRSISQLALLSGHLALLQNLLCHRGIASLSYPLQSTALPSDLDALACLSLHSTSTRVLSNHSAPGTDFAFLLLYNAHLLQSLLLIARLVKELVQRHITKNGQKKDAQQNWSCEPPCDPSSEVYCIYVRRNFLSHSGSFISSSNKLPE